MVAFAAKESAKRCVDALHGRIIESGQIVADYHVSGSTAASVSKAVWISNVFDAVLAPSPDFDEFCAQLQSDFTIECGRFGPLTAVAVVGSEGCVHVTYESIISAGDCVHAMNGRWFDERQMFAEYDLEFTEDETNASTAGEADGSEDHERQDVKSGLVMVHEFESDEPTLQQRPPTPPRPAPQTDSEAARTEPLFSLPAANDGGHSMANVETTVPSLI